MQLYHFSMAHLRIERMANYLTDIDKITVILNHVQYFVFGYNYTSSFFFNEC